MTPQHPTRQEDTMTTATLTRLSTGTPLSDDPETREAQQVQDAADMQADQEREYDRTDRLRAAFAALTPAPVPAPVRYARLRDQRSFDTDGLPRYLADAR